MFADPIVVSKDSSVTAGATNQENLVRNYISGQQSRYAEANGDVTCEISHQASGAGRLRHLLKIITTKVAADPLTAVNAEVRCQVHVVIDEPPWGFTLAEKQETVRRLLGVLTDANIAKLVNSES